MDVPIYKFPPIDEKIQCLRFADAEMSERANDGRVPATWRFQFGVVVPMPMLPEVAKKIEDVASRVEAPL